MKKRIPVFIFSVLFFSFYVQNILFAYRPFLTEDAGTSDKGVVGIEVGLDLRDPSGDVNSGLVLYHGLAQNLEVSAELPYQFKGADSGKLEVFNFGAKYNLIGLKDEQFLTAAFNISDIPKSELGYSLALAVSKEFCGLDTHYNFGGNFTSKGFESYIWAVAAGLPLSDKLKLALEVHSGNTIFDKAFNDNHVTALLGGSYGISEKLTIDGGVRIPLTDAAKGIDPATNEATEKYHIALGVTFEF